MPDELVKDILRLERKADQVLLLNTACSLGVEIIKLAQTSRRNIPELHALAHFVAEHLSDIAKCMRRRNIPVVDVKEKLDQLESILRDVSIFVKMYSMQFITSVGDRDVDIAVLTQRLFDMKRTIFLLPDMKTSPALSRSQTPISYHIGQAINRPQSVVNTLRQYGLTMNRPRTTVNCHTHSGSSAHYPHRPSSPVVVIPLVHGQVWDRSPSNCAIPEPQKDLSLVIDIPPDVFGRSFNLNNQRIASPFGARTSSLSWSYFRKSNFAAAPNLTGSVRVVKGPFSDGAYCDIYLGELTNEHGKTPVAMKMLRIFHTKKQKKAMRKFLQEVSLWCSIHHPYLLPFHGTCQQDEFELFMVSPWAEGGNSLEFLRRNPHADRHRLLWQVASALDYLHSGKDAPPIVHGDLKADNVLISGTGDALLCDFGLSSFAEEITSQSSGSSGSHVGGSSRFMAPELLTTPEDTSLSYKPNFESDVFAFASLMLQIFTEKLPFGDLREAQAILNIARGELPARPLEPIVLDRGLNDRTWTLMTDCWKFKPSLRPRMTDVVWRIMWADENARAWREQGKT